MRGLQLRLRCSNNSNRDHSNRMDRITLKVRKGHLLGRLKGECYRYVPSSIVPPIQPTSPSLRLDPCRRQTETHNRADLEAAVAPRVTTAARQLATVPLVATAPCAELVTPISLSALRPCRQCGLEQGWRHLHHGRIDQVAERTGGPVDD